MQDRRFNNYKTDIRCITKIFNRSSLLLNRKALYCSIYELKMISQHDCLVIKYMYV